MNAHFSGALLALVVASSSAIAAPYNGFTGPVAPATFTVANTGTLTGAATALGSAVFSTSQLVLTGSNSSTAMTRRHAREASSVSSARALHQVRWAYPESIASIGLI